MKLLAPILFCLLAGSCLADSPDKDKSPLFAQLPPAHTAWSVTGKWQAKAANWTDVVTFLPDGRFARDNGDAGHWNLALSQNRLVLILAWDRWPASTITMMDSDRFLGQESDNLLELQRVVQVPAVETRTWRQGEPPLRLIRKEEGFCALSTVTGCFQGGGEVVKVYIGDDGYWYLGGESMQEGVAAQCIIVRYRGRP